MGITKCWMLTGTYLLQTNKYKFTKTIGCATCKCCGPDDEDLIHILQECSALYAQRKQYFSNVKSIVSDCIGIGQWEETSTVCKCGMPLSYPIILIIKQN